MKDKFYRFLKEEGIYMALLILCIVIFSIPYYAPGLPSASENDFHSSRIMSLAESLKLGFFPPKLRAMLMKGFGYGVGFFYPDFFSYLPAIMVNMGVDVAFAMKFHVMIFTVLGVFFCYRSLGKLTGSRNIAVFMTILYFGTHCMWENLYEGTGIGAYMAQVALPVAIVGLLRALQDEKEGYLEYAIGIVVVVLSHHLTFISLMIAMVMIVLINVKVLVRSPKILGKLFGVSMVGLFFTAQYWMPAIELAIHTKFKVIYDNYIDINEHILNFVKTIENIRLGYIVLFVVVTALFIVSAIRSKKLAAETVGMLVVTLIHIYLMMSELVWRGPIGQFFAFFQSTERLVYVTMALMTVFMAMAVRDVCGGALGGDGKKAGSDSKEAGISKVVSGALEKSWVVAILGVALILVTRFYCEPTFWNPNARDRYMVSATHLEDDYGISCAEWLPVECEPSECKEVNIARASDKTSAEGVKHDGFSSFDVWVLLDKEYYDMPFVYYYGYKAWLTDDAGNLVKELATGEAYDDNGYLRVFMPGEEGVGHVFVTYRKTLVQKIAYVITGLTTLFIVVYPFGARKRREKAAK